MNYETDKFSTNPYARRIEKPWGYEIHWVPDNFPYLGKLIHIEAGKRWSLQRHDKKQESWFLNGGQGKIIWENNQGEMIETPIIAGQGYTCVIGQKHRIAAITDCDIIEVSTPELGTTERLEDDYQRPDETDEMRKLPNRGWNKK